MLFETLLSVVAAASVRGALLTSPTNLPSLKYDFVIVGAGTAGCTLAARLTENPLNRVLLIEAGGSNEGIMASVVPFLGVSLPNTAVDWNYTSIPQPGLNNRVIPMARGRVLGGTSTINLMTWNRASNDFWDYWATISEDSGWSWANMEKYYLRTSTLVSSADYHNTTGQIIPTAHGHGPVRVSVPGYPTQIDDRVVGAGHELSGRFAYNEDFNAGTMRGVGYIQSSIGDSRRSSSATAYLGPALTRPNLDVLINTYATKLIKTGTSDGLPVMNSVKITQGPSNTSYTVKASKEVILSAGVIGTPQLLLLSGIGPKTELQQLGITSVINNPSVGKNLTEHPLLSNYFTVNSEATFDDLLRNETIFKERLNEWITTHQGLFVNSPGNTQAYMRLPEVPPFTNYSDPSSGPLSSHQEMIFVDGFAAFGSLTQPPQGHFLSILTIVVSPMSRGFVKLASSNPFAKPLLNFGFLEHAFDLKAMVQTIKDAKAFIQASSWTGYVQGTWGALANATTDAELEAYARQYTYTGNHASGSVKISPAQASWGVLNPDLRLKKARGLRVVDASAFPHSPECHPQAVVYTMAERAADLIKSDYGC